MPTIHANGITIAYDSDGSGHPLLLISGLGYGRWQWHRMVPLLAKHFRVITFDNRGVGGSDRPPGPYTAQLLAEDTAALLAALDIDRATVLGHSMGGFVAQALALAYPQLVTHLILAATNFGGPNHIRISQEALLVLMDRRGDPIERLRRGIAVSTAPGFVEASADFVEAWLAYRAAHPVDPAAYDAQLAVGLALVSAESSFEQRLPQITAPTLILSGEHDKVVPPGNAHLLARQIADSSVIILPDAGHFFPFEVPESAAQAVIHFIHGEPAEGGAMGEG